MSHDKKTRLYYNQEGRLCLTVWYAAKLYGVDPRSLRNLLKYQKAPGRKIIIGGIEGWEILADAFLIFLRRRAEKRDEKTQLLRNAQEELQGNLIHAS
jgi:hypothetical protein